ncbi:unnamed protein product [Moneuplotes crassus]|uniref:Uncharacterized protein n=1 Tax=Euplotes crassus TaxID=5936 RepID=A0AAD1UGG9_EUPCR|nr:unnamed protein product [Moneuplotes crassus]
MNQNSSQSRVEKRIKEVAINHCQNKILVPKFLQIAESTKSLWFEGQDQPDEDLLTIPLLMKNKIEQTKAVNLLKQKKCLILDKKKQLDDKLCSLHLSVSFLKQLSQHESTIADEKWNQKFMLAKSLKSSNDKLEKEVTEKEQIYSISQQFSNFIPENSADPRKLPDLPGQTGLTLLRDLQMKVESYDNSFTSSMQSDLSQLSTVQIHLNHLKKCIEIKEQLLREKEKELQSLSEQVNQKRREQEELHKERQKIEKIEKKRESKVRFDIKEENKSILVDKSERCVSTNADSEEKIICDQSSHIQTGSELDMVLREASEALDHRNMNSSPKRVPDNEPPKRRGRPRRACRDRPIEDPLALPSKRSRSNKGRTKIQRKNQNTKGKNKQKRDSTIEALEEIHDNIGTILNKNKKKSKARKKSKDSKQHHIESS